MRRVHFMIGIAAGDALLYTVYQGRYGEQSDLQGKLFIGIRKVDSARVWQ